VEVTGGGQKPEAREWGGVLGKGHEPPPHQPKTEGSGQSWAVFEILVFEIRI